MADIGGLFANIVVVPNTKPAYSHASKIDNGLQQLLKLLPVCSLNDQFDASLS